MNRIGIEHFRRGCVQISVHFSSKSEAAAHGQKDTRVTYSPVTDALLDRDPPCVAGGRDGLGRASLESGKSPKEIPHLLLEEHQDAADKGSFVPWRAHLSTGTAPGV